MSTIMPFNGQSSTPVKFYLTRLFIFTFAVILALVFVRLGLWQWHKGQARLERGKLLDMRSQLPPQPITDLWASLSDEKADLEYQRVWLRGRFDPEHQIVLDNRIWQSRAGVHILTPFTVTDMKAAPGVKEPARVLVNRGWMLQADRRHPQIPPAPTTEITLQGMLVRSPRGMLLGDNIELVDGRPWPKLMQWVDVSVFNGLYPVLPWKILQESPELIYAPPEPAEGGLQNINYAYQWFGFAAAAVGIGIWGMLRNKKQ